MQRGGGGLVLVVEDEPAIARIVAVNLRAAGFRTEICADGGTVIESVLTLRPRAIVLDLTLPDVDGIDICRQLRSSGDRTPILFATARDEEIDRVLGLELGGDDYVVKPFSPRELVARVVAVLRRVDGVPDTGRVQRWGDLVVDEDRREVWVGERPVEVTATEFDLLLCLLRRPNQFLSRGQLLDVVWERRSDAGQRTVDVHVAQLRAKLGTASPIVTRRGVGYGIRRPG